MTCSLHLLKHVYILSIKLIQALTSANLRNYKEFCKPVTIEFYSMFLNDYGSQWLLVTIKKSSTEKGQQVFQQI